MQLPHPLRNLLRGLGLPQMGRCERDSIEELLKAAVDKGTEQARSNLLPSQPSKHAEFSLSVDEMLDLWAVDSQENFLGWFLALLSCEERFFRRRDHIHGIRQGTAESLDRDGVTAIERHLSPALESQGVGKTDDLVLERGPSLLLLGLFAAGNGHFIIRLGLAACVA